MVASRSVFLIVAVGLLALRSFAEENKEVRYQTESEDGEVVSMQFYGPASWRTSSGERLEKFPHLCSLTLRCGTLTPEEVRYLSTRKSIEEIFTTERFESDSVEFLPGALGELSRMTWLKVLSVHADPLPADEWRFLSRLEALEHLLAEGIDKEGIEHVRGMKNLTSLTLPNSSLRRIPNSVLSLQGLQELSITSRINSENVIEASSIASLARVESLASLTIEGVDSDGLKYIGSLKGLHYLSVSVRDPSADLMPIGKLSELRSLTVSSSSLQEIDFRFLETLPQLKFLQVLVGNQFGKKAVATMPLEMLKSLQHLIVTEADCDALEKIAALPKIERVFVRRLDGDCSLALESVRKRGISLEVGSR